MTEGGIALPSRSCGARRPDRDALTEVKAMRWTAAEDEY
jgi:hypothetical protein